MTDKGDDKPTNEQGSSPDPSTGDRPPDQPQGDPSVPGSADLGKAPRDGQAADAAPDQGPDQSQGKDQEQGQDQGQGQAPGLSDSQPATEGGADTPNPAQGQPNTPYRRETKLPQNPRRVRGGVRMKRKEGDPEAWAEQRLWRIAEKAADGDTLKEGLEYARGGQTRRITFNDGKAEASVQGRRTRAYATVVTMPRYTPEQKAEVIKALGEQARYAAKLLAGELPPSIEDVFVPIGLHLFPEGPTDFEISCTCKEDNQPWCKHAVCVTALLGEKLADDPFLVFELRGLPREHLVEGLRDFRALTTLGPGPQPVYAAHVAGVTDSTAPQLAESVHSFWKAPTKRAMPSVPVEPPEVSHPLLRRLGPSPFQESRFPLVGLLATCYELIGRDALQADDPIAGDDDPSDGTDDQGGEPGGHSPDPTPEPPAPGAAPEPEPEPAPEPERPKARPRASAKPLKR